MKKTNQLYLVCILMLLNACQGRDMPMVKPKNKNFSILPPIEIKHKIAKHNVHIKAIDRPSKKHKAAISTKIHKEIQIPILHKYTQPKEKMKKINIPIVNRNISAKSLPPLPILPSIEKEKHTSNIKKVTPISSVQSSDKIIKNIPLTSKSFSGGAIINNLDMGEIRIGNSPDYTSIIFDSYKYINNHTLSTQKSPKSGTYLFTYVPNKNIIIGFLDGYKDFSALKEDQRSLFKNSSIVENIYVVKHLNNDGIKFIIKLRKKVKVKIFDVKNPGRILVNLFPL